MAFHRQLRCLLLAVPLVATATAAPAQAPPVDTFKVAVGQLGLWAVDGPRLGQRAGIFKQHGIALEIFGTSGGGETLQAGISRSAHLADRVGNAPGPRAHPPAAPDRPAA